VTGCPPQRGPGRCVWQEFSSDQNKKKNFKSNYLFFLQYCSLSFNLNLQSARLEDLRMDAAVVGSRIRHARTKAGFSQAGLARKLELQQSTVFKWETGVAFPRLSRLARLAAVLDVSEVSLLFGDVSLPEAQSGGAA
jgi:DNA-binding transcriptional regulator YiaG